MTAMKMDVRDDLRRRRESLRLAEAEVASRAGLGIHAYCDVEFHADEARTVVRLGALRKVCDILGLNLLVLFDIPCARCAGHDTDGLPRNQLVHEARERLGLSVSELADRIGFEDIAVISMEQDPAFLHEWSLELIDALAEQLGLPLSVLLDTPCPRCDGKSLPAAPTRE